MELTFSADHARSVRRFRGPYKCVDGMAGPYPCDKTDLVALVTNEYQGEGYFNVCV